MTRASCRASSSPSSAPLPRSAPTRPPSPPTSATRRTTPSLPTRDMARTIGINEEDESHVDELHGRVDDPDDELRAELARYTQQPVGFLYDDEEDEAAAASRSASPAHNGGGQASDEDAE